MTMNRTPLLAFRGPRQAAGFTIIELMVGMLVGLLATVVMFQVFAVSEGQKRTTTGAGDAQQNGVGSVFVIERDARMAGFGINYLPMIGCPVSGYNSTATAATKTFGFAMAPYVIVNGAAGASDTLTIAYGDTRSFSSPIKLAADMASAGAVIKVYSRYGIAPGDLFILASTSQPTCTLYQVQDRPGSDGIAHGPGSFTDDSGNPRTTTYNAGAGGNSIVLPSSGTPVTYLKWDLSKRRGGRVINMGQAPTVVTYAIEGNQLVANNVLSPGEKVVVSDGVIQFQVQYGFDFEGDGAIVSTAPTVTTLTGAADQWADTLPANPTTAMYAGIIGIRFAVVSRSATPERADAVSGLCPTQVPPRWLAADRDIDVSADPNWKCYRYRVFEVTVPGRNLAWAPDEAL
ncbi:hypothetical protein DSM104443_03724 [Usitatibacter rugosus]|uniref:Type IV pilus assembly protein PilW n=2 Tax=Usitatibacter rugosus TaxID=2732067 RepID=A0A6M4H1R4_9PROT|nr:hypothetical protein DSM104443_03724 [Usitatibacter rugosus]